MTIYEELKAAGCEIDNHESDLYVKATPKAREITKNCKGRSFFISQIDRELWIDLPFRYDPFWDMVEKKAADRRKAEGE